MFKAINNLAPYYVCELLHRYTPGRSLRSSSFNLLVIPPSNLKSYRDRALSVYAPKLQSKSSKPKVFMLLKTVLKHILLKDIFVLIDCSPLPDSTVP